MAVRNARRTHRLARATTEAAVDVRLERWIIERESALERQAHEQNASTRAIVLVFERQIGGAALQAEPAVHARVDAAAHVREGRSRQRTGCLTRGLCRDFALINQRARAAH